jgi:hypothetical protein
VSLTTTLLLHLEPVSVRSRFGAVAADRHAARRAGLVQPVAGSSDFIPSRFLVIDLYLCAQRQAEIEQANGLESKGHRMTPSHLSDPLTNLKISSDI